MPRLIPIQQHSQGSDIHKSKFNSNHQTHLDEDQQQGVKTSVISFNNQYRPSVINHPKADYTNNSSKNNQNKEDIEEFVDIGSETQVKYLCL